MPRILVVDDERQILTLLSMSLRMAGYDVTVAEDGLEAMTLCTVENFDAILTDIDMPRMNGQELVRWIAGNRPEMRYAMMSGLPPEADEHPAPNSRPILRKPFFPQQAVSLIKRMLNP